MTSTIAQERAFVVFPRGEVRDDILRFWRGGLRKQVNPETGLPFTEDEIAAATVRQSRWWIDADHTDVIMMTAQQRGLYLANQLRADRASTGFLQAYHSPLWKLPRLDATGGSGTIKAPATIGSIFVGSTKIPDPAATQIRDAAGKKYQVLFTATATIGGAGAGVDGAVLTLKGIDTGPETNLTAGTKGLSYVRNAPAGVTDDPEVATDFKDGIARETDADWGRRIMAHIGHRPAAGNPAQFRAWARQASVAVHDAYVYPCAFHAGSTLVCVTAKRGSTKGPTGRVPSTGTLAQVISYLTAPGSPVVPRPPHILVVPPTTGPSDLVLTLDMRKGSSSGWTDPIPWPEQYNGFPTTITAITDQTHFQITKPASAPGLPTGVTAPALMAWHAIASRYEKLQVVSVTPAGGHVFDVVLATAPSFTLYTGVRICPDNGKRAVIDKAVEDYFDSLGPGEIVDLDTDDRAHRAFRFPEPFEEAPQRVGSAIQSYLRDALGPASANEVLESASQTTPSPPVDPTTGPVLLVAGEVAVYAK